ncbi:BRCA1-associated ATM activator 1-like [Pseudonaja textilis]|uniref:BRCA1-associated ATM activator 1-like n=1 Tax=Pseudonaja textilis TaxID=8673 RepID=UPI000EA8B583|nr:BRCA1-associated ATM activator 1-like [Pseudonaja textilis]XP_026579549.1 BRCA1-associated ATM activator 1-like [Pseudonaja textilis]
MDAKCSQLLPSVCTILADPGHPVADDTCLEKLLDWFKALASAGPSVLVLKENPCLIELILAVLKQGEPDPILLSFILRLTGIFAASESSFQYLQQQEVVFGAFGEAGPLGSPLWEDMTIRSGWVQGAYTMLRHYSAFQFLCNSGALDMIFTLQEDPSLFIAAAANRLLARLLIFSVESEPSRLLSSKDCDWPACARMMVARVEEALTSRSSSRIKHSLKLLMTLFEHSQDAWTEILWSRLAETVEALLMEDSVHVGPWFVDLFLSMARSPAFSSHECSLWKLVALALKNISLAHVGPLAHGLLKLEACPQALQAQSLAVLLQPMDGILRATSPHAASPNASSAETRLFSTGLLCQTMAHLKEIQELSCFPVEFPHQPLICSVVTILQFCAGQAVSSSSFGATLGHLLIGSFRVQRAALSLLGALSRWAASVQDEERLQVFDVFLTYLRSPDSSPVIFKKALQGTLKWLRSALRPSVSLADVQQRQKFLRDTLRVLRKHLCSPSWEVRDSSLEFLSLAMKHLRGLDWFWQELLSSEVPRLLEDLLGDPESYVRASAVRTWGRFSLMAYSGPEVPVCKSNENPKELCVGGVRLLEILSSDAEGFPRRAAIGVFLDWLKEGHPEASASPAEFVSRALQAVDGDLDWEVKMAALDLVGVFIGQTFGQLEQSSTSAGSSLANLADVLRLFGQMKMLGFLFRALQDCDRPVAVKACEVLLALKSSVCKHRSKSSPSGDASGLKKVPTESSSSPLSSLPAGEAAEKDCQDPERLRQILEFTNLEGLRRALDVSSDHLERSPQSLLQDLLAAAGDAEENRVDCY